MPKGATAVDKSFWTWRARVAAVPNEKKRTLVLVPSPVPSPPSPSRPAPPLHGPHTVSACARLSSAPPSSPMANPHSTTANPVSPRPRTECPLTFSTSSGGILRYLATALNARGGGSRAQSPCNQPPALAIVSHRAAANDTPEHGAGLLEPNLQVADGLAH